MESVLGKTEDILGPIPTAKEMAAEIAAIKGEVQVAAQAVIEEGIKDDYSGNLISKTIEHDKAWVTCCIGKIQKPSLCKKDYTVT